MSIFRHRDSDSDVFGSEQMREPAPARSAGKDSQFEVFPKTPTPSIEMALRDGSLNNFIKFLSDGLGIHDRKIAT